MARQPHALAAELELITIHLHQARQQVAVDLGEMTRLRVKQLLMQLPILEAVVVQVVVQVVLAL